MKKLSLIICVFLLCCGCSDDSNQTDDNSDGKTLKADGEICNDDSECKSHLCLPDSINENQKICTTLKKNGAACVKDTECSSGYCDEGTHLCQTYPDLNCSVNQHPYGKECESDNDQNCGSHGHVCDLSDFAHASAVACTNASCVVTGCHTDYYLDAKNKCVYCKSNELWNTETKTCTESAPVPSIKCTELNDSTKVGDICQFGRYRQYSGGEASQPIEWMVAAKDNQKGFLLISKYVLDGKKYHETMKNVTWEKSTLRSWLNGLGTADNLDGKDYSKNNFIDLAFTTDEQLCIPTVTNDNPDNEGTNGGNNTDDQLFLLSRGELNTYLTYSDQIGYTTNYVRFTLQLPVRLSDCIDGHCATNWWLRSPGNAENKATKIGLKGIDSAGLDFVDVNNLLGIRPSLWIKPQMCADSMCPQGKHKYGESCEPDDNNNCGRHGKKCDVSQFSHATAVACELSNCIITGCDTDYHLDNHGVCVTCHTDEQWNENTKACEKIITPVDCAALVNGLKVGDTITFGQYLQSVPSSDTDNLEPIEWRVLDINNENGVLIVSKYILGLQKFKLSEYTTDEPVVRYPRSALRSWINGLGADENADKHDFSEDNFIYSAFNDEQLKCIHTVTRTYTGQTANDKVFILNKEEAENYFSSNADRKAYATPIQTSLHGISLYVSDCSEGRCAYEWWLPDLMISWPYIVNRIGDFASVRGSAPTFTKDLGVRPAIWLKK